MEVQRMLKVWKYCEQMDYYDIEKPEYNLRFAAIIGSCFSVPSYHGMHYGLKHPVRPELKWGSVRLIWEDIT
jgi:hypothetical protein